MTLFQQLIASLLFEDRVKGRIPSNLNESPLVIDREMALRMKTDTEFAQRLQGFKCGTVWTNGAVREIIEEELFSKPVNP